MTRVERTATVDAAPDAVWHVLADFGAISSWVPMIQHSCLLSDRTEGVGTVRRVQVGRRTVVERVVTWEPPERLEYDLEGLPPFVGAGRNSWRLEAVDGGTHVTLTTTLEPGPNPVKRFVATKVLERMALVSEMMLAGLAARSTTTAGADVEEERP